MTVAEVAKHTGLTEAQIRAEITSALGRTETMWRCGATGRISDGPYDCSCDSVLCDLGEEVTVAPKST